MNTKDPRFELIRRHHDGEATPEEASLLAYSLREDAEFRRAYVRYMNIDVALGAATVAQRAPAESKPVSRMRWPQWRPLAAAAAGLMLGMFFTSMVWAMASPRASVKRLLALANAGFESSQAPSPDGVPVRYGIWSGDYAEITGGQQGVVPKEGQTMLHFLRSDSSLTQTPEKSSAGNLYQVVDMRPYRSLLAGGRARLDWSAWFNWVPAQSETEMTYATNVWTFTGDTSILPVNWKDHLYQETAKSGHKMNASEAVRTWRQMAGSMIVPADTDFLVVELKAIPGSNNSTTGPYKFSGCFADDVKLLLTEGEPAQPAP